VTTFLDLIEPIDGEEGREFVRGLIATAPDPIPPEVLDTPGTPEGAIVYALGEGEAIRSTDRALFAASAARSTANRPYLGVIASDVYSVTPRDQTFATTDVLLSNTSAAYYGPYDPGELRFVNDTTEKLYVNTDAIPTIVAGATNLPISVRALEAGSASTAQPNEITRLETTLDGVSVTNPAAAIGQDEETSDSLNGRVDAKIGSLGTPGARGWNTGATATSFEAIAKNGPDDGGGCVRADGTRIEVTRTQVVTNYATGDVVLYLADDDGPINAGDVPVVEEQVQTYTEWVGVEVDAQNSTLVTVSYAGTLTIKANSVAATDTEIRAAVQVELTNAGRALQIGEGPTLDYGRNAILNAGDSSKPTAFRVVSLVLSSPAADTVLAAGQVAALVLGTLTINRV
jgi:hypothetical protein